MSAVPLRIGAPPRVLEAVLAQPAGEARGGAVVCHPHPQYGGTMDTAVVVQVAAALVDAGFTALRFNFGGVGGSGGSYGGGPPEVDDARAAVDALAARLPATVPIVLLGYSFGAWIALQAAPSRALVRGVVAIAPPLDLLDVTLDIGLPVAVVVGDRDQYCGSARLRGRARTTVLAGADHFLAGREDEVAAAVVEYVRGF